MAAPLQSARHPVAERLPGFFRLLLVQALEYHPDHQRIVDLEDELLAPMRIEKAFGVELDETAEQPAKGRVGRGLNRRRDPAEGRGQFVRP